MTESKNEAPSADELVLLKNILKSLDIEIAECVFKQSFTWPVFHSYNFPANTEETYNKLLNRWLSEFFSDNVAVLVQFGVEEKDVLNAICDEKGLLFISCEDSLGELLMVPTKKMGAWEGLLPKRMQINASVRG